MANYRPNFNPNTVYHVTHHGNGKDNIFLSRDNYLYFLEKYKQYITPIATTYSYCLMPNHFHIGLKIRDLDTLKIAFATHAGLKKYADITYSPKQIEQLVAAINADEIHLLIARQFAHFLNAYAKSFNTMYERRGSLFRESVYREAVREERYYKNLVRYIHNNPVKHGFCARAEDWDYSSIHAYNSLKFSLLERNEVIDWFGSADAFWGFHALGEDSSDLFSLLDV
ncbi:MAG: hypothetical protein RLZZ292_3720 [Bacteroidota bacterium]|jgi:REP element-mobilizing transposase RayT